MKTRITFFSTLLQSKKALWIVLFSILLLNIFFYTFSAYKNFPGIQARKSVSGLTYTYAKEYVYFYFYTGNFPLCTLNKNLLFSESAANKEIETNGSKLIMEYKHWYRLGEHARILAFLPNAYFSSSPKNPSVKLFNAIVFTISLLIFYTGFWRNGAALMGLLIVVLVNFTPFFLYEIYSKENIFGIMGSLFLLVLGLNTTAIFSKYFNWKRLLILGCVSSFIVGFCSEIRNELDVVFLSLLLIYAFSSSIKLPKKIIFSLLFFISFIGCKLAIRQYFDLKFKDTTTLVQKQGGHVYNGGIVSGHNIWHNIFCGLGDYDTKYGYKWDDRVGYKYAVPILNQQYGMKIHYSGKYFTDDFYDKDSIYYIKFEEIAMYDDIIRNKVLNDVQKDPIWFLTILLKRIGRILTQTLPIPFIGWLIFPLIFYLIKKQCWMYLKLILISLPLSLSPLLIYSGEGSTYNSLFGYFILVIPIVIYIDNKINWHNNFTSPSPEK